MGGGVLNVKSLSNVLLHVIGRYGSFIANVDFIQTRYKTKVEQQKAENERVQALAKVSVHIHMGIFFWLILSTCANCIVHHPRLCSHLKKLGLPFVSVLTWTRCTLSSCSRTRSLRFVPITISLPVYSPTMSMLSLNHPQLLSRKVLVCIPNFVCTLK